MRKLSVVFILVLCGLFTFAPPAVSQEVGNFTVDGPTVTLKFSPFVLTFDGDERDQRENLDLQYIDIVFKTNFRGEATNETSFDSFEYRFDGLRDADGKRWIVPLGDKTLLNEGKNVVSARGVSTEGVVGDIGPDGVIMYIPPTPIPPTPVPPTPTPTPAPIKPPLLILNEVQVNQ